MILCLSLCAATAHVGEPRPQAYGCRWGSHGWIDCRFPKRNGKLSAVQICIIKLYIMFHLAMLFSGSNWLISPRIFSPYECIGFYTRRYRWKLMDQ